MSTANDGGPAFPQPIHKVNFDTIPKDFTDNGCEGMSLRDWFAGMALQGILAMCADPNADAPQAEKAVEDAFKMADAMLRQRNKPCS